MINLTLLSKLQTVDTVTMLLRDVGGNVLEYYIISSSVSCDVVAYGKCEGSLTSEYITVNVRLDSIIPLISKGHKFTVEYKENTLKFLGDDGKLKVSPLYVEYRDPNAERILTKFFKFQEMLEGVDRLSHKLETIEDDLRKLNKRSPGISKLDLGGVPPDNPFGDPFPVHRTAPDLQLGQERNRLLSEKSSVLTALQEHGEFNLKAFYSIAAAAARTNSVVDMCGDYAILSLANAYMLQRTECPELSIPGKLLFTLMRDGDGDGFRMFEDALVYRGGGDSSNTVVFVAPYLPGNSVDSSIVTKGVVKEQYDIRLRGALEIASMVRSKFPQISLNLGTAVLILKNELGESIDIKFEVTDTKSIELNKLMRGERANITETLVDIPKQVQGLMGLMGDKIKIHVKERKVVFQSDKLFLVFGR